MIPKQPLCNVCNKPIVVSLYSVMMRELAEQHHLCSVHFSQMDKSANRHTTAIRNDYALYDLACLFYDHEKQRFAFRLDPSEGQGRPIYVGTGYIELSLLLQNLDRTSSFPTIHRLVFHWMREMSYAVDSVFTSKYTHSNRHFETKIVLKGDKVIHLGCRLSDGVALAAISGCRLYVAKNAEEGYYETTAPEEFGF